MKKLLMIFPLVFLICFTFSCQQSEEVAEEPVVDVEADVAAIKASLDEWVALYNAGDFNKIMSIYYAENAVKMPPNIPMLVGKEAILSQHKLGREQNDEFCESSFVQDVRLSGDLAVVRGVDTGTITPKSGGEPIKYNMKWLIVLERQPDGTWKWIYEIWNDNNPLPTAPEKN
jgi:ketosteroid isomerase-like protein